jgi:glycosyltransferase involved in cell wall biosynthesis
VLVLPSLWEGFGIVLIEAMAAGKPVITTNVSNMPEIVNDGENGFLVPPSDPDALSTAMQKMASNRENVRRMGRAGRRVVQNRFTLGHMVDTIEKYFFELCARK